MRISTNYELKEQLTSGVHAIAERYIVLESMEDISAAREATASPTNTHGTPTHILWWGSNVVPCTPVIDTVWHPARSDRTITDEDTDSVSIRVGAGMSRDGLVRETIHRWRWWVENLIAIPGCVGAAPIQNIGAYGVEVKDVITSCETYHFATGQIETISTTACAFGYRDSIFKQQSGQHLVCYVTMRLSKHPRPILTYAPVVQALHERGIEHPTQSDIADTIEAIRWSKLPKPEQLGNTGSFFKNPIVPIDRVNALLELYPTMPHYPVDTSTSKIPAARLIEQTGLKGTRHDAIGTFPLQPLVIVNYGGGTGQQIADFAAFIIHHVNKKFGIVLHPEVQFWT